MSVAAGPLAHDLVGVLRELGADAEAVRIGPSDPVPAAVAGTSRSPPGGGRAGTSTGTHGSATAVAAIAAADPRTVIVDVGYPSREPLPARGVVTTFGAGRASLTAAAERLTQLTALTAAS